MGGLCIIGSLCGFQLIQFVQERLCSWPICHMWEMLAKAEGCQFVWGIVCC